MLVVPRHFLFRHIHLLQCGEHLQPLSVRNAVIALAGDDDVSVEEAMTLGPSTVRPSFELDKALDRMCAQDPDIVKVAVTAQQPASKELVDVAARALAERDVVEERARWVAVGHTAGDVDERRVTRALLSEQVAAGALLDLVLRAGDAGDAGQADVDGTAELGDQRLSDIGGDRREPAGDGVVCVSCMMGAGRGGAVPASGAAACRGS